MPGNLARELKWFCLPLSPGIKGSPMNRMAAIVAFALTIASGLFAAAPGSDAKTPAQVGTPQIRTTKAMDYFYVSVETNLAGLPEQIKKLLPGVARAAEGQISGPPLLVYHGVTGDPDKKFQLEIGFPVKEGTQGADNYKVKKLEEFRCVSLLYTGPTAEISRAYEALRRPAAQGGHAATDESRQMMLYWEGEESPNNVIQIMVGIR